MDYKQQKAIEKSYYERLKKLYPDIDYSSGIYIFKREVVYIGKSKSLATRIINHIVTKNKSQHIDASIAHWKINNETRKGGWRIEILEKCPTEKLDERETFWIDHYANDLNYELYNVESGGTSGKTDIGERKERGGYRKGKEYGYNQAIAKIQKLERQRHETKKDGNFTAIALKAQSEWDRIIKGEVK